MEKTVKFSIFVVAAIVLAGLYYLHCGSGGETPARIHTCLDLIDIFPRAVVKRGGIQTQVMTVGKEDPQSVISFSPGSRITFRIFLHEKPRVLFKWGIKRGKKSFTARKREKVVLGITVSENMRKKTIFQRELHLDFESTPEQWHSEALSLEDFAGSWVFLSFSFEGGETSDVTCGLANPQVTSGGTKYHQNKAFNGTNVVLISMDTLRADHLHCYGYPRKTSPALDRLAEEGTLFERAYAQAYWTLPSHISLFTSLYPDTHRVPSGTNQRLDRQIPTLASLLKKEGYRTEGFAVNGYFMSPKYGLDTGFDHYSLRFQDCRGYNRRVARWLEDTGGQKFFLFMHLFDPHSDRRMLPYDGPEAYLNRFARGYEKIFKFGPDDFSGSSFLYHVNKGDIRPSPEQVEYIKKTYDAGVLQADDHLAFLMKTLKRLDLLDHTLIVVSADHGEEFMEHGKMLHKQFYEELIHVPLVFYYPDGGVPKGKRALAPVENIDIMPTILDLLGIKNRGVMQGRSLVPIFQNKTLPRKTLYGAVPNEAGQVVYEDPWKLILHKDGSSELFNLRTDPDEMRNLQAIEKAAHDRLVKMAIGKRKEHGALLERIVRRPVPPGWHGKAIELTSEEKENLKALGYLEDD